MSICQLIMRFLPKVSVRCRRLKMNLFNLIKQEDDAGILEYAKDKHELKDLEITAMIRLGLFADAHRNLQDGKDLRKSYCLLKLNQPEKALDSLPEGTSRNEKLLKAQILNRLEKEESLDIYKEIEQDSDEEDVDRQEILANQWAVKASLGLDSLLMPIDDLQTFEEAFNFSTWLIHKGRLEDAEKSLDKANALISEMDDSLSDMVKMQRAVILQIKGFSQQAKEIMESIQSQDDNAKYVLKHNLKLDISVPSKNVNLTLAQKKVLKFNQILLDFLKYSGNSSKINSLKEKVLDLLKKDSDDENLQKLYVALLKSKSRKWLHDIKKLVNEYPASKVYDLALVQVYIDLKDFKSARDAFKGFFNRQLDDFRFRPSIVSCFVFLEKDMDQVLWIFRESISYWRLKGDLVPLKVLLQKSAEYKLSKNMYQEAAKDFEELLKLEKNDLIITGLISAYAGYDPIKAKEFTSYLPSISIPNDLDVDKLESFDEYLVKTDKIKRKRKRTIKYPKNYNPSSTPDPERWLPKHERSSFKKKKGKKEISGFGSQGMTIEPVTTPNQKLDPTPSLKNKKKKKR